MLMRSGNGDEYLKGHDMSIHVVVMGVAGCGKSTVAAAIHERLGFAYAEGDDFHPQANIDKMSAGIPLTDEDRWPWLKVINTWMAAREALGENTVVSSSALKRSYREVLAKDVPTFFIHLNGSHELIQQRLNERKGHFMPPALLPSQFAMLEPLQPDENGVEVSIEGSVDDMVERAIAALDVYAASESGEAKRTIEAALELGAPTPANAAWKAYPPSGVGRSLFSGSRFSVRRPRAQSAQAP